VKIILISNYPPGKQESMKLFAGMLHKGFIDADVESETWLPTIFFGALAKIQTKA